jgi:hypothetical protein
MLVYLVKSCFITDMYSLLSITDSSGRTFLHYVYEEGGDQMADRTVVLGNIIHHLPPETLFRLSEVCDNNGNRAEGFIGINHLLEVSEEKCDTAMIGKGYVTGTRADSRKEDGEDDDSF